MGRSNCCCNLPYIAVVSTVVASVGLALWWKYLHQARDDAVAALQILGVSSPLLSKYNTTAAGYLIFACVDLGLLGLLALWRSSLLCRRDRYGSSSTGMFKFLATLTSVATFLVVLWSAINLAAMGAGTATLGIGHFAAQTAGNELTKLGGATNLLDQVGTVITAYDNAKSTGALPDALLQPISPAVDALRPFADNSTSSCAPFCLDMNSFKFLDVTTRCVCDGKLLKEAAVKAKDGAKNGLCALVGCFILLVGLLWALMNICGQLGGACSDSWHAEAVRDSEYKQSQFQTAV